MDILEILKVISGGGAVAALLAGIYVLYFILDRIVSKFLERLDAIELRHYEWEKSALDRMEMAYKESTTVYQGMSTTIDRLGRTIETSERTIKAHENLFRELQEDIRKVHEIQKSASDRNRSV